MRLSAYVLLLILFSFCSISQAHCADTFTRGELKINGVNRVFYYHAPRGYSGQPTALVFLFHGGGGNALDFSSDIRFITRADENNFIAVAPQGYEDRWNYGVDIRVASKQNDIEFATEMIAFIKAHYNVDPAQIYFGGFSEGAWFTQWATYQLPNVIAAAAAVCALEPVQWQKDYGHGHPTLPILFMLGTSDPRMHWNGGITPNGTQIISATATVLSWVRADECWQFPRVEHFPNKVESDRSRVELSYYQGAKRDDVAFYEIIGGGHAWPGAERRTSANGNVNEDIDATQMIWDFFKTHPKRFANMPAPFAMR